MSALKVPDVAFKPDFKKHTVKDAKNRPNNVTCAVYISDSGPTWASCFYFQLSFCPCCRNQLSKNSTVFVEFLLKWVIQCNVHCITV